MRISELSTTTGVSVPTLKYYLREGLLHPGEAHGATRASYDDSHVERVRLVRTLIEVGRLSIDRVREVVQSLDAPPRGRHELLGTAHHVLRPATEPPGPDPVVVDRIRSLGLPACADSPASLQLAQALSAADAGGWPLDDTTVTRWLVALRPVAETDVDPGLGTAEPGDALRHAIVGNVLTDPVLLALRRVAQEAVSAERFGGHGRAGAGRGSTRSRTPRTTTH